jgi:hypothetical protein
VACWKNVNGVLASSLVYGYARVLRIDKVFKGVRCIKNEILGRTVDSNRDALGHFMTDGYGKTKTMCWLDARYILS